MNKNVLVISSSPRKGGNSDLLCDQFVLGAKDSGNKVEKVFLRDYKINPCMGCEACYKSKKCVQNDEMHVILNKMIESDVIVMATPVYFYSICGQLKIMIDRTVPRYLEISNKEFYFIVTAADNSKSNMERTIECLRGFTFCLDGANEKGIIYGIGVNGRGEVKNLPVMKEAYDMGKSV